MSVGSSSLVLKPAVLSTLVKLMDGYASIRMEKRPCAAVTGLNFFGPACTENSARSRIVGLFVSEASFVDGASLVTSVSTDGGFFFDVTDVQSDMTLRFRFKEQGKPASRVLVTGNREFSGD